MSIAESLAISPQSREATEGWFADNVHHWGTKRMLYMQGALSENETKVYDDLAVGQIGSTLEALAGVSHKHFVTRLLDRYFEEVGDIAFELLAFDWQRSKVIAWAAIPDGHPDLEDRLYLAEASINREFHPHGYALDTIVVEKSDEMEPPPHYVKVQ